MDGALENLYQETAEDKLEGIHKITSLLSSTTTNNNTSTTTHLDGVVENDQLIGALARLFSESSHHPIELTFGIGKIFLSLSLIEDYHEILSSHLVGSLCLDVIDLQLKRALHRGSCDEYGESSCSSYAFTRKEENVLYICLSILDNLANEFTVLRKMVKKSLVQCLLGCIHLQNVGPALSLLKKASIFEETAIELLSSSGVAVISRLAELLLSSSSTSSNDNEPSTVQQVVVITLFNLSFHQDCVVLISNAEDIHSRLVTLLRDESLVSSTNTLQLMYHLSSREEDRQQLYEAGVTPHLVQLLKTHTSSSLDEVEEMDLGLVGLLVNMTLNPLCSEEIICHDVISHIFNFIQTSHRHKGTTYDNIQVLLKVVRNLSSYTRTLQCRLSEAIGSQNLSPLVGIAKDPDSYIQSTKSDGDETNNQQQSMTSLYWDKHYFDSHVEFIIQRTLACNKCANDDLLVEWLGIMSNLTRDDLSAGVQWQDLLHDNSSDLVELFHSLNDPSCHDDIKLELIILLGTLCGSEECSHWIASNNIVDMIHSVFIDENQNDAELKLQILSTHERLMYYEVTRFQIMGGDGVVLTILDCLTTEEESLRLAAENCLILIEDFDRSEDGDQGEIGLAIQEQRYEDLMQEDIYQTEKWMEQLVY